MRIVVRLFPQTTPMKRIKLEGLNDPSQNICFVFLCKTLLTKELEREKELILYPKDSPPLIEHLLYIIYTHYGGYIPDGYELVHNELG